MNNDLNSALALFRSLYKAQKGDIYTIIGRFILVGVKSKGLMSFSLDDLVKLLDESFHINIPFSVIQRCIISLQDVFKYSKQKYVVINSMDDEIDKIIAEIEAIEAYKEIIKDELVAFVEDKKQVELEETDKVSLGQMFFDFVIDKERIQDLKEKLLITQFIIAKENDERFQHFINSIREGMVIYKGIRYSESPNDTSWEHNTDFFLDEEYLFSAYGMNGPFFEKCFYEFYNLVKEINDASMVRGGRERIRLYYFHETKTDVDSYFAQAVRIRRMQERYNYPQTAMDHILNACNDDVAVEQYKIKFYHKLKDLHIEEYPEEIDLIYNKDFLFESDEFEKAKDQQFSPDQLSEVNDYIKIADYINILRCGKRGYPIEKCGYMFLSDGNLSNELSRFIRNFYDDKNPIVITRMGTFTELMWFKLRKGVIGMSNSATISVVNKAKTVVSGLLYDNLKKQYDEVLQMDANENEKKEYYADLRTKRYTPDDITRDTITDDIAFIDDVNYLEKYKVAQTLLKNKAEKVEYLEKELEKEHKVNAELQERVDYFEQYIRAENNFKRNKAIDKARVLMKFRFFWVLNYVVIINIFVVLLFVIPTIFCMDFLWLNIATIVGTFISVAGVVNVVCAKMKKRLYKWVTKKYAKLIKEELNRLRIT